MDALSIADRRRLRRKLGFWRILAILAVVLAAALAYLAVFGDMPRAALKPHIARIAITGMIQDDAELVRRIDEVAKTDSAKALVVSISSPGGTTYGGEQIFNAIRKVAAKKPVVSDIRTLAASAGYLVATAGDLVIAGDTSITGSIGVIFQYPQVKPLLDKLGVSLEEIKSAPMKAEPSPFHVPPDEARAMIRAMVDDSYSWFVDLVAERRSLPRATVLQLADGRILTGRQALALKLVDKLGDDDDIRDWLVAKGLDKDLEIVDWDAPPEAGPFGFRALTGLLLRIAGLADSSALADIAGFADATGRKLNLDGLVSLWQVDTD